MRRVKYFIVVVLGPIGFVVLSILYGSLALAQETQDPLTLEESIKIAMERSLTIHSAVEGVAGSEYKHKETITNFLPSWTGQYAMGRYNAPALVGPIPIVLPVTLPGLGAFTSRDVYGLSTSVNQPFFTGGLNLANYRSAKLGVDLSKTNVETARRDLVLQVRVGYFTILRAEKYLDVAEQQAKQFEAQLEVTKAFFDAEKVSMNDVLQAQVSLADARQSMAKAANDVATAKASFNTLLRREVTTPFEVVDILAYKAFPLSYEQSLEEALRLRPEIKAAQININQAKENVKVARSGFFPTINLSGNYSRSSDMWTLQKDFKLDNIWSIQASATFTLWNWGNTAFKVGENKVKVTQAEDSKNQLIDSITLEVRDAYLNMLLAEKNIRTAETAIEQAEENLRMFEERYKYQVATQTDVIIAVTFLTQARTNYYSALSDFNIAEAQLERAMGRMYPQS
ncbi:MAG: TolC family protein [bacterium]